MAQPVLVELNYNSEAERASAPVIKAKASPQGSCDLLREKGCLSYHGGFEDTQT